MTIHLDLLDRLHGMLPAKLKRRVAKRLRYLADDLDREGAVRLSGYSFTFELGVGMVFRDDDRGCRVAYFGDEYERSHAESGPRDPRRLDAQAWLPVAARPGVRNYSRLQEFARGWQR